MTGRDMTDSVCLVGAGRMGGALLSGWLSDGRAADSISVIDPYLSDSDARRIESLGVRCVTSKDLSPPDILVLATKPQDISGLLPTLSPLISSNLVISIAAGVTLSVLGESLGSVRIIRSMPNLPCRVKRGITVCVGNELVDDTSRTKASELLGSVGLVEWITDESLMDSVTAVSGSGPAYLFHLVEALTIAGERSGLPPDLALRLARETVCGSGELLYCSDESAVSLREGVTSPGGTTAAAFDVLTDSRRSFVDLLSDAVSSAARRSRELSGG